MCIFPQLRNALYMLTSVLSVELEENFKREPELELEGNFRREGMSLLSHHSSY